jgi:hypothetical protein
MSRRQVEAIANAACAVALAVFALGLFVGWYAR